MSVLHDTRRSVPPPKLQRSIAWVPAGLRSAVTLIRLIERRTLRLHRMPLHRRRDESTALYTPIDLFFNHPRNRGGEVFSQIAARRTEGDSIAYHEYRINLFFQAHYRLLQQRLVLSMTQRTARQESATRASQALSRSEDGGQMLAGSVPVTLAAQHSVARASRVLSRSEDGGQLLTGRLPGTLATQRSVARASRVLRESVDGESQNGRRAPGMSTMQRSFVRKSRSSSGSGDGAEEQSQRGCVIELWRVPGTSVAQRSVVRTSQALPGSQSVGAEQARRGDVIQWQSIPCTSPMHRFFVRTSQALSGSGGGGELNVRRGSLIQLRGIPGISPMEQSFVRASRVLSGLGGGGQVVAERLPGTLVTQRSFVRKSRSSSVSEVDGEDNPRRGNGIEWRSVSVISPMQRSIYRTSRALPGSDDDGQIVARLNLEYQLLPHRLASRGFMPVIRHDELATIRAARIEENPRRYQVAYAQARPVQRLQRGGVEVGAELAERPARTTSATAEPYSVVDQLFRMGLESAPVRGMMLQEVSGPAAAANSVGAMKSAGIVEMRSGAPEARSRQEIELIADKVSRIIQQRNRFERERRGGF